MNFDNFSIEDRISVARQGRPQDLDVLVNDDNEWVRMAVAKHGRPQDLDVLVHDEDAWVRWNVAEHGRPEDLDILVNDKVFDVRLKVAEHGRPEDLDVLVNDKHAGVRATAQRQLDILLPEAVNSEDEISAIKAAQIDILKIIESEWGFPIEIDSNNIEESALNFAQTLDEKVMSMQDDINGYEQDIACIVEHVKGNKSAQVECMNLPIAGYRFEIDDIISDIDNLYDNASAKGSDSEPGLDAEAKDMSAAKDAQDAPAAGHDKDKGVI